MLFCRNLFISGGPVFLLVLGLVALTTGFCADLSLEQQEIRKAATRYLEAEVQRDLKTVYASLAPSSDYLAAHNFEAFLEEAKTSPVRIVSYQILNISLIGKNPDKVKYPRVTRTAQVEVDVVILYTDTNQRSVVNYAFPFVQEGGKWYKL
ncbi:MAG: hypothetical protein V2B13_00520 [Pseudomonadota bacterium]